MGLRASFREVYKDESNEIKYTIDSLFYLHIALMFTFIALTIIYVISKSYTKVPIALLIELLYVFSFYLGFRKKYNASSIIMTTLTYLFLAYMVFKTEDFHPESLYKVALYLSAPTMLTVLLVKNIKISYIFTFTTLAIVIFFLQVKIVPANPDITVSTLFLRYFLFVLFLLVFIAYSTFQKHRITVHLQSDAKKLFEETVQKSSQMSTLLDDVQKSIGITSGLITEVNSIKSKIKETNEKLLDFSNDMEKFRSSFSESSIQLSGIGTELTGLNDIVHNQSSAQEESAAATNQLVSSIGNVSQIVNKKVESAEILIETTKRGGEKLENTVTIIQAISNRVDSILEMVEIINNIATNTNLLSMNAAIEAAHAGDAGKGFAVVAEEIRKLAEESSQNSESIAKVLSEVVGNIKQSYELGVSTLDAYGHIISEVNESSNAFHEISSSTTELSAGTKEILIALTELTELTRDVRGGTGNITTSQEAIEMQLNNTGSRIDTIMSDISTITQGNRDIEISIEKITEIAETIRKVNEDLNQESTV